SGPEPLGDGMEVRRLDSTLFRRVVACDTTPGCAESNPAGGDLVEDGVGELLLDLDPLASVDEVVVLRDRTDDRGRSGSTVEPLEPLAVAPHVRNPRLPPLPSSPGAPPT